MKKFIVYIFMVIVLSMLTVKPTFAAIGDFGYFGGISEGIKLPKTTEMIILDTNSKKKNTAQTMTYKEEIFLSGKPVEFDGIISIKSTEVPITDEKPVGSYTVTYDIKPGATVQKDVSLLRNIVYAVNYRKEGTQVIKDYEMKTWKESVSVREEQFVLDPLQSHFGVSILEDLAPGVTYYKGNLSKTAVYIKGGKDSKDVDKVTVTSSGDIYGYNSAWSTTETHRIDSTIEAKDWQMQYQERPSVGVNKTLQYSKNEPLAISFSGNYKEVVQNKSGLKYDIFIKPQKFYDIDTTGELKIDTYNTFEQLISPDLGFLKGNFAQSDIEKLFAMQVLSGDPKYFRPEQAMTRGEFTVSLVKAIKLPIEVEAQKKTSKTKNVEQIVFPDVPKARNEYPYIMAAFKEGLIFGRTKGNFYPDAPITREEAIVLLLRVLGLKNLGLDPTPMTSFVDNEQIVDWAKQEIYAADKIGIISADEAGMIKPKNNISKADGAAFINRLINYMREDVQTDYAEHVLNYS